MPWFRLSVAGLRPRIPPISNRSPTYVTYVMDKVGQGQVFPQAIPFPRVSVTPSSLYTGLHFHASLLLAGRRAKTGNLKSKYSRICYNERCYNERMLQRTVFINKIRILQRTKCYNEQFLSIKSECYNERCYNE